MSNLIPGNHKHLTLEDRQFIEQSLNSQLSFREIAKYLCKDPSTISKEVLRHRIVNTWNRGSFNNPYTSVSADSNAGNRTPAGSWLSVTPCADPATSATMSVLILNRNTAAGSNGLPMSVTAAKSHVTCAPYRPSTITTQKLPGASTKSCVSLPEKALI